MDLAHVIVGPVVTEKAEAMKSDGRTYTLRVAPKANKVDVKKALRQYYDVDVEEVRVMRSPSKVRRIGSGRFLTKRKPFKKVIVKLTRGSKSFDIANFKS